MQVPAYVHTLFIKTTKEELWEAITKSAYTRKYFYGSSVESEWREGSAFVYRGSDGRTLIEGLVIESAPGKRLVLTQRFLWNPRTAAEQPSRITYEIHERGRACSLTVTQDDFPEGSLAYEATVGGWPWIASGLKSVLETGTGLPGEGPSE